MTAKACQRVPKLIPLSRSAETQVPANKRHLPAQSAEPLLYPLSYGATERSVAARFRAKTRRAPVVASDCFLLAIATHAGA